MSTSREIKLITIDNGTILKTFLLSSFGITFFCLFVYACCTFPEVTSLSITFFACTASYGLSFIPSTLYKFVLIHQRFGERLPENVWESLQLEKNRIWSRLLQLLSVYDICVGCWYISIFIPANRNHCGDYSDFPVICASFQIMSVFTIMSLCCIGLLAVIFLGFILAFLCLTSDESVGSIYRRYRMKARTAGLSRFATLPAITSSNADTCSICLEDGGENNDNNNCHSNWVQLPDCGHKYHDSCINTWIAHHSTCPMCRAPVLLQPGMVGESVLVAV